MQANFNQQLAAMQAQLPVATSAKSDRRVKSGPTQQTVINVEDDVTSPFKAMKFDPFHIVKQYSPAATTAGRPDRPELMSAKQALFAQEVLQQPRWSDVLSWSLQSPADRARCADEYKALSCLLVHACTPNPRTGVMDTLRIRAPCGAFCKEFLLPVFTVTGSQSVLDPPLQYMRMVIYHQLITNFKQVYAESFFQADNLRQFLQIANWEMDDIFEPAPSSSSSWTVYHFLKCLSSQASTFDGRLPINGISILEAKHLGMFVYHWFRAMDMKSAKGAASFDSSLLAIHLRKWNELTDHPMLHSIWQQAPRDITYWWFRSLREILLPFQLLAMSNRYSDDGGFTNDPNELTITSSCGLSGPTFDYFLDNVTHQFHTRWANARLTSVRSFQSDVQDDHFRQLTITPGKAKKAPVEKPGEKPGEKRTRDTSAPHFIAAKPLFNLIGELPTRPSAVTGKFLRHIGSGGATMFKLTDSNGKSRQICLKSCCQPPWNQCAVIPCEQPKRIHRDAARPDRAATPYLHVDMAKQPWCDAPESTWDLLVGFLKQDGVSQYIQPSEALKAKTPNARW